MLNLSFCPPLFVLPPPMPAARGGSQKSAVCLDAPATRFILSAGRGVVYRGVDKRGPIDDEAAEGEGANSEQ